MRIATCFLALGFVLGSSSALASDSFTCGEKIVETGMSLSKVRELCGDPTAQSGDRWIYDRGPDELVIVLHIAPDDTVSYIEAQPRE